MRSRTLLVALLIALVLFSAEIDAKKKARKTKSAADAGADAGAAAGGKDGETPPPSEPISIDESAEKLEWGEAMMILTSANWTKLVVNDTEAAWLVMFYEDSCGHCQELHPVWNGLAHAVSGLMNVGAVNCKDEKNGMICNIYAAHGMPSIVVFGNGVGEEKKPFHYRYDRSPQALIELVMGNIPRVSQLLTKQSQLDTWLTTIPALPRCVFLSNSTILDFRLNAIAFALRRRMAIGQIPLSLQLHPSTLQFNGTEGLVCFEPNKKDWSEGAVYENQVTFPDCGNFMSGFALPEIMDENLTTLEFYARFAVAEEAKKYDELAPSLVRKDLEEASGASFVQFCHRWMPHCVASKALLPEIAEKSKLPVVWVDLDMPEGSLLFDRLRFVNVPTSAILPGQAALPVVYEGDNKVEDIVAWVNNWVRDRETTKTEL